jgi:signal transduction histidine kinase
VVLAGRAKDNFLAVMSHELRTPLSAITGYAGLLEEGIPDPPSAGQRGHLRGIRANAARLLQVIEEILDFSRLELGGDPLRLERVDLQSLVSGVAEITALLAAEHGLALSVSVPEKPFEIRTDPEKVRQILLHLTANALKFTEHGRVQLIAEGEDGVATFRVVDTGIGIAPELQEKVFEPFFQAADVLTREVGGTGVGLAVARGLARSLGGDVTVQSRPGEGSTFTLTIVDQPDDVVQDGPLRTASPSSRADHTRAQT